MRNVSASVIGVLFIAAGALHFRMPRMYEQIVPPYLPAHREIVAISGFFEMLGGAGVLLPKTRVSAGYGLIALLLAVLPANIYMATDAQAFAKVAPAWVFYARLPLQFVLIWWVYGSACAKRT
jgi:uncharacterized membrane protein